MLSLEVFTIL